MKFVSSRGKSPAATLSEAMLQSLAPDGGLFVPEHFPKFTTAEFKDFDSVSDIANHWLKPFFEGDPLLAKSLKEICRSAFSFPIPLRRLDSETEVLELFHGPTSAFKDVGARFLAECLSRVPAKGKARTVLVATSGDTGGAVAAAFHGRPGFEVRILFPKDKVSARQEKQLTSWGGNVRAFRVRGDFDDCQRIAKEAFQDDWWKKNRQLVSANSINLGRLLPQAAYYVAASLWHARKGGGLPTFIIPSGNLGNATACLWAKETGLPIGPVVLAMNANRAVAEYRSSGLWAPRATLATLSNAMDVGNPSNMERVISLYPGHEEFRGAIGVCSVSDSETEASIANGLRRWNEVFCPHTATAVFARAGLEGTPVILVATAHPAKFETIVEPIIKRAVEIPPALKALLKKPAHADEIEPTLSALREAEDSFSKNGP